MIMNRNKKSFLLHIDSLDILDELTDEQAGKLFKAIKAYQKQEMVELDSFVRIAFSPFKNQFIRDNEKYDLTCKRRAEAGRKGGEAKSAKASKPKQELANASNCQQELANVADNKNKNKNKTKNKSDSDNKNISTAKAGGFTPPTDIETVNYFCEKKSTPEEAEKFWYFYDAKNWMVGKNKMKNWKSAASGWIARNKGSNKDILAMSAASDWHKEEDQGF